MFWADKCSVPLVGGVRDFSDLSPPVTLRRELKIRSDKLSIQKALDMKWFIRLASMAITLVASAAHSADIAMRRVLSCAGPDAKIEVYIPETAWAGAGVGNARLDTRVVGAYALDLSAAGKGKTLEPVHVQYSKDKKAVIIDQYTRKFPPTLVAVVGGTVDFDQRFATGVRCGSFNQE
jgi:hypothetical protein